MCLWFPIFAQFLFIHYCCIYFLFACHSSSQTRIRETDKVLRCLKHSASLISTQSVLRRNSANSYNSWEKCCVYNWGSKKQWKIPHELLFPNFSFQQSSTLVGIFGTMRNKFREWKIYQRNLWVFHFLSSISQVNCRHGLTYSVLNWMPLKKLRFKTLV